mgnify:CR=1 FL=1
MALDVETPAPPDLTNRPLPTAIDPDTVVDATGDLRRGELETALRDGAWDDAFDEWTEYTDLTDEEFRAVHDAGLIDELDVYWHPDAGSIEFETPPIPDTVGGDAARAARTEAELADLGEILTDVLADGYLDWEEPGNDDDETDEG